MPAISISKVDSDCPSTSEEWRDLTDLSFSRFLYLYAAMPERSVRSAAATPKAIGRALLIVLSRLTGMLMGMRRGNGSLSTHPNRLMHVLHTRQEDGHTGASTVPSGHWMVPY